MSPAAAVQPVRTGTFAYVRHAQVFARMGEGWMVVRDLGGHHGFWSALMWRCACFDGGPRP